MIADLVSSLPDNLDLGLLVYGHRRKAHCDDIELMVPPGPVNRGALMNLVNSIRANGKTPLTKSLFFAADALNQPTGASSFILVTDGLETCAADPCDAARKLEPENINFTAHVIAFDLDATKHSRLNVLQMKQVDNFWKRAMQEDCSML